MSAPVTTKELRTLIPESTATVCDRLEKATLMSAALTDIFSYMLDGTSPSNQFQYDICAEQCETTTTTSTSTTTTSTTSTSSSSTTTATTGQCVYATEAIPTMVSNTSPSGVCSASELPDDQAYRAFDNNDATACSGAGVNTDNPTIQYQFPSGRIIKKYRVKFSFGDGDETASVVYVLQGTNNPVGLWSGLDAHLVERNSGTGPTEVDQTWQISNSFSYAYYRVGFAFNYQGSTEFWKLNVYTVDMYECQSDVTTTTSTSTTTTTTAP